MADKKIRILYIPADPEQEPYIGEVEDNWRAMGDIVEGYIEVVHTEQLQRVHPQVAMVINEEGLLKQLPPNPRATQLYPYGHGIVGNAILVGEAKSREYFIDLPEEISSFSDIIDRLVSP